MDKHDDSTWRMPPFTCPRCGYRADAVGELHSTPEPPRAGDINACMACGLPMMFVDALGTGSLQLRPLTDAEIAALPEETRRELDRVQAFGRQVMRPYLNAKLN